MLLQNKRIASGGLVNVPRATPSGHLLNLPRFTGHLITNIPQSMRLLIINMKTVMILLFTGKSLHCLPRTPPT